MWIGSFRQRVRKWNANAAGTDQPVTANPSLAERLGVSRILLALLCLAATVFHSALAAAAPLQSANKQVIASASGESVRFASFGELIQIRLELIGSSGEGLFDSGFKSGNVIDWSVSDSKDKVVADGSYLCLLTIKDSAGVVTKKRAIISLREQSLSLKRFDSSLLTSAQTDAAGPEVNDEGNLTIVEPGASTGTTVLAHDAVTAHLVSGSGGLSIGSGDFFANRLLEHVRLTASGDVGIGVSNPQAKLDVAGAIRAGQGIIFPDGSIQFSAARKTLGASSHRAAQSQDFAQEEEPHPSISGSGTTGQIPKWQNGPSGVLSDSVISEFNGSIGINGAPDPTFKLDVNGHNRFRGSNVSFYLTGLKPGGNEWLFQTVDADGRLRIFDNTSGVERLSLTQSGRVGIGTASPGVKLDVAGSINATTQYNIDGRRMLSESGTGNLFVGRNAGNANSTGESNTFVGSFAGSLNTTSDKNTFFGATAGLSNTEGSLNSFFGEGAGLSNKTGAGNSFFGRLAGYQNTTGDANSFFGRDAGSANTTGESNTIIGAGGNVGAADLDFATAIGAGAVVSNSNHIVLGRSNGEDIVLIPGFLTIPNLAVAGSTELCRNAFDRVGACSSSLRYKTNLAPYLSGLTIINRLRPISFNWKDGGMADVGFGAEEVEKIEPLLVTYNKQGQVEGVKYDRITVALVNAIKEQQEQIQGLEKELTQQQEVNAQLKQQQNEIAGLKKVICAMNPTAEICHK